MCLALSVPFTLVQLYALYVHDPQDVFSELLVPVFSVDANRMKAVVCYSLAKCLSQFTENRSGLLLKSSFVTEEVARALIDHGYKHTSQYGYACPVQVSPNVVTELRTVFTVLPYACMSVLVYVRMFAYPCVSICIEALLSCWCCALYCACPTLPDHSVSVLTFLSSVTFFSVSTGRRYVLGCETNEEVSCSPGTESVLSLIRRS